MATATATKLRPLGDRVVVQPTAREEMTKSGIVLPDTAKEKPQEGKIIAAGPGRLNDEGEREPMDVKVGDKVLYAKGAYVIPDFLCNAGGVTVSYFEGVQNDMNFYWSHEEVLQRLDEKMRSAFKGVLDTSLSQKAPMRDAAYMVAIDRVVHAMQFRGWL